jgi:hypothetical protein
MDDCGASILVVGESDVGKTHYGAQLLRRLMRGDGGLRMNGAATNLEPFEAAMKRLDEGMTAEHTPTATYIDSIWPVVDDEARSAQLIWPDYGGEQVKAITATRKVTGTWRARVAETPAWVLMIRLNKTRVADDLFSRPLAELKGASKTNEAVQPSDQSRLVELLQILLHARGAGSDGPRKTPRLAVLLSCWDEMATKGVPNEILQLRLPMLADFVNSNWADPIILGLSALGRQIKRGERDAEYATRGPEHFGYVVDRTGNQMSDLTIPIRLLLADRA